MEPRLRRLVAVERLAVCGVAFAADGVRHARRRHEIALVGGIDEHLSPIDIAGERLDRHDLSVLLHHAIFAVKPFAATDVEPLAFLPSFKDLQRCRRFKRPHRFPALRSRALSVGEIRLRLLTRPPLRIGVVRRDGLVELQRDAAERRLVADVGLPEAAGGESADARLGRDDHRALAHPLRLHRRRNRRRTASVDDDVAHRLRVRAKIEAPSQNTCRRTGRYHQIHFHCFFLFNVFLLFKT